MELFKKEKKKVGRPRNKEPSYIVNFRLPKHLYDKLVTVAQRRNVSMSAVVKDSLNRFFGYC